MTETRTEFADTIITQVEINFSLMDRLRILLKGDAHVRVEVDCQNLPGRCVSRATSYAPRLFRLRRASGYAEVADD